MGLANDVSYATKMRHMRAGIRLNSRINLRVEWKEHRQTLSADGYTVDISPKGCLAIVAQGFPLGQKMVVTNVFNLFLLFAACCYFLLFSRLPAGLRLPVAVYSMFLVSMAAQAMGRSFLLRTSAARFAAIGALLFVLSDGLLALNRFYAPLRLAPLLILVPYYTGQWLIASSTDQPSLPL